MCHRGCSGTRGDVAVQSLWFYGLCCYFQQWLRVIEQRVSSVSVSLSLLPFLPLSYCLCVCMFAHNNAWDYPTVYFMSCFQGLLLGDSNSSIVLWWALNSHKSMAHTFPAARPIVVPCIAKWAFTESQSLFVRLTEGTKVSLFLILALLSSHLPVSSTPSSHYSYTNSLISMWALIIVWMLIKDRKNSINIFVLFI